AVVVLKRHVPQIGTLQCSAGNNLVVLVPLDLKHHGRALVNDGPTFNDHLMLIARRLDGPQLGHADFPLRPESRPLIPLGEADGVPLRLVRELLLHGLVGHATVDELVLRLAVIRLRKWHSYRPLRWPAQLRPSRPPALCPACESECPRQELAAD